MDVLLTGRIFSGAEGKELGLINRAVPKVDVLATAMAMANDIAENTAPVSVAITKRLMYDFLTRDWPDADRLQRELFAWTGQQPDAREGVTAFLERRPPQWTMSKNADLPAELVPLPKNR
jgi:enoyl-CoA hydratase/carnithine racemase